MTVTNFDINLSSTQELRTPSLTLVSDLMTQIREIQDFLTSAAICELGDIVCEIQQYQAVLISDVSNLIREFNKM